MMVVVALLFFVVLWIAAVAAGAMAAVVIFPVTAAVSTIVAVGLYCAHASQIMLPDAAEGRSPVARPAGGAGRDPAYRHYLASQVWKDLREILNSAIPLMAAKAGRALNSASRVLVKGDQGWFLFPVWLAVCGGVLAAAVPVALLVALIAAAYTVTVAVGLIVWLACVGGLRAVEQVLMLARRILQACPYPGCYERFTLPVYACSTCGSKHRRLTPDLNGAFWHVCACGTRLPTTILLGRYRLQAHCPQCDRTLPTRVGRVRIEPLPLAGGPDAGKTTFMALAVDALHRAAGMAGGSVLFVDKADENAFRQLRRELSKGKVAKTPPDLPRAVMLDVKLPGRRRSNRILYLFDPSGEHYTGASRVEEMRYLAHGEALVLVIDPFALPEVQNNLLESERQALTAKGVALSREDPADTFTRLRNELAARADGGKQRRVAVVLTKADLLATTTSGRGVDDLPGWFALMGLGNLVRELKNQGVDARYLASGLPPKSREIARLFGWLTGLRLDAEVAEAAGDLTTGDAREPWDAKARPAGSLPLSYLVSRRSIAAVSIALSTAVVVALAVVLLAVWSPKWPTANPGDPTTVAQAPAFVPMPKAMIGKWRGPAEQPGSRPYRVEMVLKAGDTGAKVGSIKYPGLDCSGSLTLEPGDGSADRVILREQITADPRNTCVRTGWIALTRAPEKKLAFLWYDNPDAVRSDGPASVRATLRKPS